MKFTKMEGLGNDFVVVEADQVAPADVRRWCDRRRGIGADGVLALDDSPAMRYWNADGGAAQMCGNGLRCVARYATDRGWQKAGEWFEVTTPVGPRRVRVDDDSVIAEIGPVELGGELTIEGRTFRRASIGNPHAVTLVDDPDAVDVASIGPKVGANSAFPEGANVEFVARTNDGIRLRVWERGVGETLACGSGMVVAAAVAAGSDRGPIAVTVPGGDAVVYFEAGSGFLTGPAVTVFTGEMAVED
ncbi:MAG: diaminopimelate epimerase [Acidimicrobiia bacterium]